MRYLLDTRALLWWLAAKTRLSRAAESAIGDPASDIFVSSVSAFEIATKSTLGKLGGVAALVTDFTGTLERERFTPAPVTIRHAIAAGCLPMLHKDPFDRLLIAQSQVDDLILISNETLFDRFGVRRLW